MALSGLFGTAIGQDAQGGGGGGSGGYGREPVLDKDLTAPPVGPSLGDRYIVAAGATGAWAGHDNDVAEWAGAAWDFETPSIGWFLFVVDEGEYYSWSGVSWTKESFYDHAIGGASHLASTLAELNTKVSDATLDDSSAARTPTLHASTHQDGGADEVATVTPAAGAIPKADGTGKLPAGFIPATTPSAHAASHEKGGADELTAELLKTLGAVPSEVLQGTTAAGVLAMAGLYWTPPVASLLNTPPVSPSYGDRHRVGLVPTGAFVGHTYEIAEWGTDDAWHFRLQTGDVHYRTDQDEFNYWSGSVWKVLGMYAHSLAGSEHIATTLASLNAKVSDATLDDSSASRTPTAHAASHQNGGADEVATATPGANAIPKADGSGKLDGWVSNPTESIIVAVSDEVTPITAGTGKVTFRMPYAMTLSKVKASVNTAPTGSGITVDINEAGTTILSTKLTIDATETSSETAATPAVISDANLADDAEITIDIDAVGSTVAGAGLKVTLIGIRA